MAAGVEIASVYRKVGAVILLDQIIIAVLIELSAVYLKRAVIVCSVIPVVCNIDIISACISGEEGSAVYNCTAAPDMEEIIFVSSRLLPGSAVYRKLRIGIEGDLCRVRNADSLPLSLDGDFLPGKRRGIELCVCHYGYGVLLRSCVEGVLKGKISFAGRFDLICPRNILIRHDRIHGPAIALDALALVGGLVAILYIA